MDRPAVDELLQRAALRELKSEWRRFNEVLFGGHMSPPLLALSPNLGTLGRWLPSRRTLELSVALVTEQPWTTVCEVLKHEMAHQFVSELLGRDHDPHGALFAKVCADRGIDPRASGLPAAADGPRHKVIERVAKLLALATSANEHEAQTAMNAAQRLMLDHNIASVAEQGTRTFVSRGLGEPSGRLEEARALIGVVLARFFFVEIIQMRVWLVREAKRATVLEVTGTPENVAMAEYVHDFLDRTASSLWSAHKKAHGIRGDRERRAYRAGVITGFMHKLTSERMTHQMRGLVWVGDPELNAHYRKRHPRIHTVRTGGSGDSDAREEGVAAGRTVVLSKGVEGGGGGGGARRALGDGRG